MQLGIREAAGLLNASEKTLYRWIKDKGLPAFKVNEQYRFNRAELLEWATSNRVPVSGDLFAEPEDVATRPPSLAEALKAGGIHFDLPGHDKASVLKNVIDLMPLPEDLDPALVLRVLLAREDLGSTAIGDGIAIPHVRTPIVTQISRPMVTLCFLKTPIEFDAVDGQPVHTLFTLMSPNVKAHLGILARLSYALRHPPFTAAVANRAPAAAILAAAETLDHNVTTPAPAAGGVAR